MTQVKRPDRWTPELSKALLTKKRECVARSKQILADVHLEKRDLDDDEAAEIDELAMEIDQVNRQLDTPEKRMTAPDKPNASIGQPYGTRGPAFEPTGSTGAKYAEMFSSARFAAPSNDNWDSAEDFFHTLGSGLADARLSPVVISAAEGHHGLKDSLGGYSVPTQFSERWLDLALEDEIVRSRATIWPMDSDTRKIPRWNGYDHSTSSFTGGLKANWTEQLSTLTQTDGALENMTLNAMKLAVLVSSSNELVADGLGFVAQLERAIVKTLRWELDYAFLQGTGAGEPLGVLNDPAKITVAAENGQAETTIEYENLVNMFARMHPAGRQNAIWVCNNEAIPELLALSLAVGTGGSVIPVMSESNGVFTILTRPVIFTEKLPVLGTEGDLLFVDFSQYQIGVRQEVTLESSGHVGFKEDATWWRSILRVDGRGGWRTVVTPRVGGDTLSWIISLATRG